MICIKCGHGWGFLKYRFNMHRLRQGCLFSFLFFSLLNSSLTSIQSGNIQNLTDVNTPFNDYMPFISYDGKILFFQSDRPSGEGDYGSSDLWMSKRNNGFTGSSITFHAPENLGLPINTTELEGMASLRFLSEGEWEIYFTSIPTKNRLGTGETDIFYSKKSNGIWNKPTQLEYLNTVFHERMPYISPNGRLLLFSSNRPGGFGGDDLWASVYDPVSDKWSPPFNLGSDINTRYDESAPTIHHDNSSLFFTSNRPGGLGGFDLYFSFAMGRSFKKWKPPISLGEPYNSQSDEERVSMAKDAKFIYFSSNRANGAGLFDIYRADAPSEVIPKLPVLFQGNVLEEGAINGIEANMRITDNTITNNISTYLPKGNFDIRLESGKSYQILITAPGYGYEKDSLDISRVIQKGHIIKKVYYLKRVKRKISKTRPKEKIALELPKKKWIKPILAGPLWVIYYKTDQYSIPDVGIHLLKEIYEKWRSNRSWKIKIDGHTDSRGSKSYNNELSQRRAAYTRKRLMKMGVTPEKIETAWYDFSRPEAVEDNEEGRSKNRRVEIHLKKN